MRTAAAHARRHYLRTTMATATPLANGGVPPTSGGANAAAAAGVQPSAAGGAAATSPATRRQDTTPLSAVVKDAVRRWYEDALREAERGDVVSWAGAGAGAGAGGRARCFRDPCALFQPFAHPFSPRPSFSPISQKQQALLSQMLIEGYGCTPDPVAAERWAARARRRGYRMEGVYCTI